MPERQTYFARRNRLLPVVSAMCVLLGLPHAPVHALEVGFQGLLELEASDNVLGANSPNEEDGSIQSLVLGVYGEQRSQSVTAAFSGEIDTQNTQSDDDSNITTITRFLGAAEFKITPRSWTWYVGDILGGIRNSNDLQPIDDIDLERRNVFVTGPAFSFEQQGISRTEARALFVNQTQNNEDLETLYIADISHERDLTAGSFYGASLGNIFTEVPDEDDNANENDDSDFNRLSAAVFYNKKIGFLDLYSEIGVTRFDTDNENLDGFTAELRGTRQLGPQTTASVFVLRELIDQNLSTVQSLVQSANQVGVAVDSQASFFIETTLGGQYSFESTNRTLNFRAGISQLDFEFIAENDLTEIEINEEDRQRAFVSGTWSEQLAPRFRSEVFASFESEDFDNVGDNNDSLIVSAQLFYALSRSFTLEFGISHDRGTGLDTRLIGGADELDEIDVTENRVSVGLRWAPPSRASQELTVELRSLLQ